MVELKRNLGFWTIFAITVTSLIGTGIFFGVSLASEVAGNASILAWTILGITIYVAACFGELSSMYPSAGGLFDFTKHAYGKGLFSFLIGWTSWIVINMMNSLLIVAALDYLLPSSAEVFLKISLAVLIILILNFFAYLGTDRIAVMLGAFAVIITLLLVSFIAFGIKHIDYSNYQPFFSMPFILIFYALFFIVETFFGWENATFMAEETYDPQKTIPRALIWSAVFVSVLGLLLAIVMLGVIPWQELSIMQTPLTAFTSIIFDSSLALFVQIAVALALIGSAAGGLIGSPRLLLGLARDKLFIEQLADIHPKFQTPYKAIIFQTVISIIVVIFGFGSYTYLLSLLVPLALLMYITVILCVPVLRAKRPNHPRPFKVWFGKIGPIIVSLIYIAIVAVWLMNSPNAFSIFKLGLSFILFGIPIFLLIILYYDPESIKNINDIFARISVIFEPISFPKKFRKELINYFEDLEDKTVLDYGSGVGTLTIHLARSVGPKGVVFATDLSPKNVEILKRRLKNQGIENVIVILDEHQINRIHPSIKDVDVVFSVGMLGYIQDIRKVLRDIARILPKNGRICLVEYTDYFWILPNVKWLTDDRFIEDVFRASGFSVHIVRRRKLFWSYVIIYGIKTDEKIPYI